MDRIIGQKISSCSDCVRKAFKIWRKCKVSRFDKCPFPVVPQWQDRPDSFGNWVELHKRYLGDWVIMNIVRVVKESDYDYYPINPAYKYYKLEFGITLPSLPDKE